MLLNDKLAGMTVSDPSMAVADFVTALPPAQAIAVADPATGFADLRAGDLVLGIGVPAGSAGALLGAAARTGVAGVVLREPRIPGLAAPEVDLHWLPANIGWNELQRRLLDRTAPQPVRADDELAELAQTIATLTGGLVTIEDLSARVLAYSRSSDEVDDLRRLSILGRTGPPEYLALLRDWGVYDRLAAGEVVEVAAHPESGIRRRLATGVFAGDRQLGTIWLQQGSLDFGPHAGTALVGAARLAAAQLVGPAVRQPAALTGLFAGGTRASATLALLGRAGRQPGVVAVLRLAGEDAVRRAADLTDVAAIADVHAIAFRQQALVEQVDDRVYLYLPAVGSVKLATPMLTELMADARRLVGAGASCGVGPVVPIAADAARSRRGADAVSEVTAAEEVLTYDTAWPRLVTRQVEDFVAAQGEWADERVQSLIETDRATAATVLACLDTGSDVTRVAADQHIHPTTVRYRLRKAGETLQRDLTEPDVRLAVQLQLRAGLRMPVTGG